MFWNYQIFIIHCTKFSERKSYLGSKLDGKSHPPVFWCHEKLLAEMDDITPASKEVFGRSLISCGMELGISARSLVKSRRKAWVESYLLLLRYLFTRNERLVMGSLPDSNLKLREIDLELQQMHILALREGIRSGAKWILVLEDDSIFSSESFLQIEEMLRLFDWEKPIWLSLGDGAGLKRTASDRFYGKSDLFEVKPPAVRCSSAYLVSRGFIVKFLSLLDFWGLPDWLPIDYIFHLSMKKIPGVKTYWKDSPMFFQGSESGDYKSGLR